MRTCIMLACYNRREITRRCLKEIFRQISNMPDYEFDIYVYDDGSTDGTYEIIQHEFPKVKLIRGNGNAYWCKSMYYLMNRAVQENYDFYLMINDDVQFDPEALNVMFESYYLAKSFCGIVGSTRNCETGEITYGGLDVNKNVLKPNGTLQKCHWANWNCFLIDKEIIKKVGIIDGKYQHAWGDFDYSFRMTKNKIPMYVATDYIGKCNYNSEQGTFDDKNLNRKIRLKRLFSAKGIPFYSYARFNIKTNGIRGVAITIYGYCSLIWHIVSDNRKV